MVFYHVLPLSAEKHLSPSPARYYMYYHPLCFSFPLGRSAIFEQRLAPVGGFSEQTKENGCVVSTGGRLFCGMLAGRHKNVTVVKERSLSLLLRSFGKKRLIRHKISPISV